MELETRHIVIGLLVAIAVGAGYAWHQNQPAGQAARAERHATSASVLGAAAAAPSLYKWRDDAGVLQYTDQPPVDRDYEIVSGTPNVNSVPTVVPDTGLPPPAEPQPTP